MISFVSIIFLLHPKLAQSGLSIFRCVKIDDGLNRVRIDTDMECYSGEHIKWCWLLGLPIILIWVLSAPIIALILMYQKFKNEHSLDSKIMQYFLILYQGLRPKIFYWEFVNSLRKVLILLAFLLPDTLKIVMSTLVLVIIWRIQTHIKPYKDNRNNEIEIIGITTAVITLLCGLTFNQNDNDSHDFLNNLLLAVLVFWNIFFILNWLYMLCEWFRNKYKFISKVRFIKALGLFKIDKWLARIDLIQETYR